MFTILNLSISILFVSLPDFSSAGCDPQINSRIPNIKINIIDFGAVPDDGVDD